MELGEAVVLAALKRRDGSHEVELEVLCPAGCERLNVTVDGQRVSVPLPRGGRGMVRRRFAVAVALNSRLKPGDAIRVECFYPGEQAGVHQPNALAASGRSG